MHQVYLLLRNNQQQGPYSLQELLQLDLKPFDLVWVEGKSAAWRYPGEIDTLRSYVAAPPDPAAPYQPVSTSELDQYVQQDKRSGFTTTSSSPSKTVFVSYPDKKPPTSKPLPVVQEPEIQRQHASSYQDLSSYDSPRRDEHSDAGNDPRARDSRDMYQEPLYRLTPRKKPAFQTKDVVLLALVLIVISGGIYLLSGNSETKRQAAVPDNKSLSQLPLDDSNADPQGPVQEETVVNPPDENNHTTTKPVITMPVLKKQAVVNPGKSADAIIMEDDKSILSIHEQKNDDAVKEDQVTSPVEKVAEPKEKKKKLGEKIKDLFSKKDKKDADKNESQVLEEPKTVPDRQSKRRGEDDMAGSQVSNEVLAEKVDVTSNAPDNWMMGVKGLKVTLRNRNNLALQSASVQVLYYDTNNSLLETKSITFSDIPANGKMTQAAPDHKWADHIELKLVSVAGKEDRYASNK